jgi:hypothetical protein
MRTISISNLVPWPSRRMHLRFSPLSSSTFAGSSTLHRNDRGRSNKLAPGFVLSMVSPHEHNTRRYRDSHVSPGRKLILTSTTKIRLRGDRHSTRLREKWSTITSRCRPLSRSPNPKLVKQTCLQCEQLQQTNDKHSTSVPDA